MLATLLFLILVAVIFINSEYGQNVIARQVTVRLSKTLKAEVSVKRINFSLFNKMSIEGLLIRDQNKDTLLYAGAAQVLITDWFFFKEKAELNYVALENAVLFINRTDSTWNYKFLEDYFAGGGGKGSKEGISFDLKKMELRNVYILKRDAWLGQNMVVRFGSLNLDANKIDISEKVMDINSLQLTAPYFAIKNYTKNKPASTSIKKYIDDPDAKTIDSLLKWNAAGWNVLVKTMTIDDGVFKNERESATPYFTHFDGRNIEFSSIDGRFDNLRWNKDTISAQIKLDTKERSGIEVRSLTANFRMNPQAIELKQMELRTNKSLIRDHFAMRFDDFTDMNEFIGKVRMEANFRQTEVDSDDIAFFAPDASRWNKRIRVSGRVTGTVDDLFGRDMVIEAGRNTILNGDISLVGLPNIDETFIDFKADDFRTTYTDAITFVPKIRRITNPKLQNITYLQFNGSFTGFIRDFVTYGTITTNLGTIRTDLNMKLPPGKEPVYSGTIATSSFRLGDFIDNSEIGNIAFEGKVSGQGLQWNTLSANIDGRISEIVYNDYHYRNVIAKGSIQRKLFNGTASVNDSNARFTLEGVVDLRTRVPHFDFVANVDRLNLKALNFSNDDYSFRGKLDVDFTSDNIDNFLGDAKVTDAVVLKDGQRIPFDSLVINAKYIDGVKYFTARSNEFDADLSGNYTIRDLPNAFKLFLNKYYPAYIKAPNRAVTSEAFTFDVRTRDVDAYLRLIDSNMSGLNNSHIAGKLNLSANQLELKAEVPMFVYKNMEFQNINLDSKGDLEKFELNGTVDNITINDTLNIAQADFSLLAHNDISDIRIKTASQSKNIPSGNVNARVQSYAEGLDITFDSSMFVMNGKTWTIEQNGNLSFRTNPATDDLALNSGNLILHESNQEIKLFTRLSEEGYGNDIEVQLKNVNVGDFSPFLLKNNRLEGLVSGNVTIEDPKNKFNVHGQLTTDQLRLDNDSIGQAKLDIVYNNKTGELKANGQTLNPNEKVSIDIVKYLKDPKNEKEDIVTITPENYPVDIVERFIGTLFADLTGYATGQLKIIGEGSNTKYVGKMSLHNAGLRVKFTQCFYKILDTDIEFKENELDLGQIKLLDTITGHTATLTNGIIRHNNWRNMVYDIHARVDNEPIQLLNTGPRDNSSFYGRAKGTGTFSLTGPQREMRIKVNAVASNKDSSYITLPSVDTRSSGIADFLIERKYGRELTDSVFSNETNVFYDVDLTANPLVNIRVILDELTGDEIKGRGDGNLRITSGTDEPLSLRGRYNIQEGSYLFTFQSFFKKPFELKEDAGNYIEWNGDPYQAYMKIDAVYQTEKKVSFAPIMATGLANNANVREYVYVIAKLRGDLFAPRINFELDFPPDSPPKNDPSVAFSVNQMQANESELQKQVAFLVVFNSFAPSDVGSGLNLYSGVDIVVNSISGFLSNQINTALNNFLSKQLNVQGLSVNFSGSLYNPNPFGEGETGGFGYDRSNFNFSLGKALFNDRFIITFEGNLDVPITSSTTATQLKTDFLKNVTTEILINKTGTLRATFFYRENVDFLTGASTSGNSKSRKYGTSLAYRRDFNGYKKRKPKTDETSKQEAKKEEENKGN